jgi:hypothetical protein
MSAETVPGPAGAVDADGAVGVIVAARSELPDEFGVDPVHAVRTPAKARTTTAGVSTRVMVRLAGPTGRRAMGLDRIGALQWTVAGHDKGPPRGSRLNPSATLPGPTY